MYIYIYIIPLIPLLNHLYCAIYISLEEQCPGSDVVLFEIQIKKVVVQSVRQHITRFSAMNSVLVDQT